MSSNVFNAVVQIIAGIVGGNAAGAAAGKHDRGILINTIAGAVGGGLGGFFLHGMIPALVNGGATQFRSLGSGDIALRVLAGFIAGGLLALIFSTMNFIKDEHINNK